MYVLIVVQLVSNTITLIPIIIISLFIPCGWYYMLPPGIMYTNYYIQI